MTFALLTRQMIDYREQLEHAEAELMSLRTELAAERQKREAAENLAAEREARWVALHTLRPIEEYREDFGFVLWHHPPLCEPPYVGSPNCSDFEHQLDEGETSYYTHWSPLPDCNELQDRFDAMQESAGKEPK